MTRSLDRHSKLIEAAAFELYAAGPWGKFEGFLDGGLRCATDAHSMATYRLIVEMVLDEAERHGWDESMKWVRAFNSLEKPVTNHIERCMDADDLARAHRAVMRKFGPKGSR